MVPENIEKIRPQVGLRRNSTGSFDINTSQAIDLPTYLKDSMTSCHDYCKYGIKREFATKARTPFTKRPPIVPDKSSGLAKNENVETKKSNGGTSRLSSNVKNSTSQVNREVIQQKKKEKTITLKYPNELKLKSSKVEVSSALAGQAPNRRHSDVCIQPGNFRNRSSHDVKNDSKGKPKFIVSKNIDGVNASKGKPKFIVSKYVDGVNASKGKPKFIVSKKVEGVPAPTLRSAKPVLRNTPKQHAPRSKDKLSQAQCKNEPPCAENPVEKILYIAEMTTSKEEVVSIDDHSRIQLLSEEINDPSKDIHPSLSLPHDTEDMSYNDKAIDFTKFSSSLSGDSISFGTDKGSSISSCVTDSEGSPRKLKFKKGKNADDKCNKSGPRRLKFRPGKTQGRNQSANAEDKGKILRKLEDGCESIETSHESIKVVLHHQSPEEKRQSKNLYNAVIEETARKLVKTRKSKVKALVGAFEAVISLEDNKS